MEAVVPFVLAAVVGIVSSAIAYVFARKSGLAPVQREYVVTLEDLNAALDKKIAGLEDELDVERSARRTASEEHRIAIEKMDAKIKRLERTVVSLAEENDFLRTKLKLPARNGGTISDFVAEEEGV